MSSSNGISCCERLVSALPSVQIAYPNSTSYSKIDTSYWSLQESSLNPSCIVTPRSSQEVADVVATLTTSSSIRAPHHSWPDHGAANRCRFAIKAQGHAPAAGFANIDAPGLTIDLTSLRSISVNDDHSIASVGAGASWLEVYTALDPLGKSVAGGRNGQVGVGGLTLGGGISYFSPQVGFTCDTVENFELVLANGQLINANASSSPDVFRALKGGGNNFGIVTRFDFRTVDIGLIAAGAISHPITPGARRAVFDAFVNIAASSNYDVHASTFSSLSFNSSSKRWTLSSTPRYTLPVLHPPFYDELFAAPNITSEVRLTNLSTLANEPPTPPLNWLFRTATYGVSASLMEQLLQIANASLSNFDAPGVDTLLWGITFEPFPTVFSSHGAGTNILGTSPADGNSMFVMWGPLWTATSASESASIVAKSDEILAQFNAVAEKAGLLKTFVYANYAGANQQPYESYGQANLEFLRQTAARVDKERVFQNLVPGGFKLFSATRTWSK